MEREQILKIIEDHFLRGILEQDGWETLELTVRDDFDAPTAEAILNELSRDN